MKRLLDCVNLSCANAFPIIFIILHLDYTLLRHGALALFVGEHAAAITFSILQISSENLKKGARLDFGKYAKLRVAVECRCICKFLVREKVQVTTERDLVVAALPPCGENLEPAE